MNLADALERKYFSNGTCIIKQGDSADAFYIVEDGTVKITKDDPVRMNADSAQFQLHLKCWLSTISIMALWWKSLDLE